MYPLWIMLAVWALLGYAVELYAPSRPLSNYEFHKNFSLAAAIWIAINALSLSIYFIENPFKIFILIAVPAVILYFWRIIWRDAISSNFLISNLLLIGTDKSLEKITESIGENQTDFKISSELTQGLDDPDYPRSFLTIAREKIKTIVIPADIKSDPRFEKHLTQFILRGLTIIESAELYEMIFKKIPADKISGDWILRHLSPRHQFIEKNKKITTRALALILFITLLPLLAFLSIIIKITSAGPAIYSQIRTGRFGQTFLLHKFRSMRENAETGHAQWAAENDNRTTTIGAFLRATHLDELPQLWNIAAGDLAFIGPRPERPELIGAIKKEVPHFDLRLAVTPGITGWAQINYHYGRSIDDAREKLEYDLYYIKNRGIWLDLTIIIRTIKHFIA